MNTSYFIAKKIYLGKSEDKKVSRPITRIARISIVLAVIVNIITIAVVTGFQNQVKEKVTGFSAHATIMKIGEVTAFEASPIKKDEALVQRITAVEHVKHIQPFAYKPALLQSTPDTTWYQLKTKDTFQIQQEIQGVALKGVDNSYNWDFFKKHLIAGKIPIFSDDTISTQIIVSNRIARDLKLKLNDRIGAYFVKSQPVKEYFTVSGIFETGLEELDKKVIVGDLRKVQYLNDWGIQSSIRVADTLTSDGQLVIFADVRGGNGNYRYDWGEGFETTRGFTYCDVKDTTIRLIASDYWMFIDGKDENNVLPDTSYLHIKVSGNTELPCYTENPKQLEFEYLNDTGTKFALNFIGGKRLEFEYVDGPGSHECYIGGYELITHDFSSLETSIQAIKKSLNFGETENTINYRARTIIEDQSEIFLWLGFLDLNVLIILSLMILVSTINMGSGLLVLIITKTSLIGLLKAIGTTNWTIRKIFLYQAVFIILKGMVIGNVIGIGLCLLQQHFTLIPLNPEVYYLNAVPVELNFWHILLLNIGTLILCTLMLILPSYVITKISPIKALKFD